MIDAYEDTFTDAVWEGQHRTLWPLSDDTSARNTYFKKRMASLRKDFAVEIKRLKHLISDNDVMRKEIRDLRDNLFSGTSVLESRKSVEMAEITVNQGINIRLLTLVNIFFLPLTFVTSVFGMTNMPTEPHFWPFGVVLASVCLPCFLLVGSMNTNAGMEFWRNMAKNVATLLQRKQRQRRIERSESQSSESETEIDKQALENERPNKIATTGRSLSAREGIKQRSGQFISASSLEISKTRTPSPKRAISFADDIGGRPRPLERTRTGDERLPNVKSTLPLNPPLTPTHEDEPVTDIKLPLQETENEKHEQLKANEMSSAKNEKKVRSFWNRFGSVDRAKVGNGGNTSV